MTKHLLEGARRQVVACSRGFLREDVYEIVLSYYARQSRTVPRRGTPRSNRKGDRGNDVTANKGGPSSSSDRRRERVTVTIIDTSNDHRSRVRKDESSFLPTHLSSNFVLRSLRVPASSRLYASPSSPREKSSPSACRRAEGQHPAAAAAAFRKWRERISS